MKNNLSIQQKLTIITSMLHSPNIFGTLRHSQFDTWYDKFDRLKTGELKVNVLKF